VARFTGSTVELRSVEPHFSAERDGRKPNTLRQMTDAEYAATLVCERVRIVGPDSATFEREITSVVDVNDVFELETCDRLVVISWKHDPKGEREQVLKTCPVCGKPFDATERPPSSLYCSKRCATVQAKREYRKRKNVAAAKPALDADCAACISVGVDFSETCMGKPCPHWRSRNV